MIAKYLVGASTGDCYPQKDVGQPCTMLSNALEGNDMLSNASNAMLSNAMLSNAMLSNAKTPAHGVTTHNWVSRSLLFDPAHTPNSDPISGILVYRYLTMVSLEASSVQGLWLNIFRTHRNINPFICNEWEPNNPPRLKEKSSRFQRHLW